MGSAIKANETEEVLTPPWSGNTNSIVDTSSDPSDPSIPENIQHMEIDTRKREWCWKHVTLMEVIQAIQVEHEDDYSKSVVAMRPPLNGIFKLETSDYTRYLSKTIVVRGVELSFVPRLHHERRQNIYYENRIGTLIKIYDANLGIYQSGGK